MQTAPSTIHLTGLTKCLIKNGLLTEQAAVDCMKEAQLRNEPLISYLVKNKYTDSKTIAALASVEFGIPFFDLNAIEMSLLPIKLIGERLIRQYHVLPLFSRGNRLFIATSDPTNIRALNEIRFHTRFSVENILVEVDKLTRLLEVALEAADNSSMKDLLDSDLEHIKITDDEERPMDEMSSDVDDAPIVRYVNKILMDSIKRGVSDIHFEPFEKTFRVRYRADGILSEVASPPANLATRIISRIKVMSRMDIAERRVPQDGRIKLLISKNRTIDFRVNACPTLYGEKVVIRILDPTSAQIGIESLGFEEIQREHFLTALQKPYGMVLVTGPTGSGKTVSLYTGLNILNSIERNISTAEDPVEITVEGINQVNVNIKAGLTFAEALRAFLRQDPDVIMVGEIRDLETASIAIKAAQTGHMVLSTLHTNDATGTINRLMQMGLEPFNIASAVTLIVAQRLARRLCKHCKKEANLPDNILLSAGFKKEEIGAFKVYEPVGCENCTNGYKGRVGIFQVLPLSDGMRDLILRGGNALEMAALAKSEGINDLRMSGLLKVRQGLTSLTEIDRVTKE